MIKEEYSKKAPREYSSPGAFFMKFKKLQSSININIDMAITQQSIAKK